MADLDGRHGALRDGLNAGPECVRPGYGSVLIAATKVLACTFS